MKKTSFAIGDDYTGIIAFVIALMISHGFSYFYNYIGKKEFLSTEPHRQMFSPYGRIIIMQITVILGFGFSQFLPSYIMVIFVVMKTLFDLGAHLRVHALPIPDVVDNTGSVDISDTINFTPKSDAEQKRN